MSGHRRARAQDRLSRLALTAGAVLGAGCLLAAALCLAVGVRPMVVASGSMGPAIPAGSLAFAQDVPAADVGVGDVVAVARADGTRVMHRVVSAEPSADGVALTLQGDANPAPDEETYVVDRVLLVRLDVPALGHPVSWLSTPWGLLVLGAASCGLVAFAFRRVPADRRGAVLMAGPVTAFVVAAVSTPTQASFSDTGSVTSGPLATHAVVSQAAPTCTEVNGVLGLGNIARVTWSHVDARYEYVWELRTTGGSVSTSGVVGGGQGAGSTVTVDLSTGLVGTNANYNLVVRARLRTPTTWIASTTTTTPVRRASVLILGVSMRCGHA